MTECGAASKTGVVVGGGLLGLECAKALRDLGLETHVVEFAPRLMAVQVDEGGGRMLRQKIEELGVHGAHRHATPSRSSTARARATAWCSPTAPTWTTDMIVFSAGIRPRDDLARQCGAGHRPARRHRDRQRTAAPATPTSTRSANARSWNEQIFGLVAPGYDMARVAARHIAGDSDAAFVGADMSTKLKLMGVDVASIGDAARQRRRQPHLPVHRRAQAGLQEDRGDRGRQVAAGRACWWAMPPNTARCCR